MIKIVRYISSLACVLIFSCPNLFAQEMDTWLGVVVGVADGDTIAVLHENQKINIRLYGVDTPEKKQAFGNKAKGYTNAAVRKKSVKIVPVETDKYGRTVAMVFVDGQCLNEELVRDGFAWVYRKYCKDDFCRDWLALESSAREKGRGLWANPEPTPPWEWRKEAKGQKGLWGKVFK